jgi:hypothetical protein
VVNSSRARSTFACSLLLWLRDDMTREAAGDYLAGRHGELVARAPGFLEYRQHLFNVDRPGLWPAIDGVQTRIPRDRHMNAMLEITWAHVWSPLLIRKYSKLISADEREVFARTLLYVTGPRGGRWFRSGFDERVGARSVALLRKRDDLGMREFRRLVNEVLGPALASADGTRELRTQAFLGWRQSMWDTPGVAHDNPPAEQFHASVVLGATDRDALVRVLGWPAPGGLQAQLHAACSAIHA